LILFRRSRLHCLPLPPPLMQRPLALAKMVVLCGTCNEQHELHHEIHSAHPREIERDGDLGARKKNVQEVQREEKSA
jgi:hypothetical protein